MSLYGPKFHFTPVDLCIIFQCNLYISCIVSCGIKIVSNCLYLALLASLSQSINNYGTRLFALYLFINSCL